MTVQARLDAYRARVDEALLRAVEAGAEPVSLYEPSHYVLSGGGKRVRPLLLMLAAEAVGGSAGAALDAGVALEIFHNFTLVHDDMMDHAPARRGRPSVHVRWDENVALLVGDMLVGVAYQHLLRTETPRLRSVLDRFTACVITVCEGQALDKVFESRTDVSLGEYLDMIAKKTGCLIAVSLEIGGLIGGGSETEVAALRSFGEHLGRAFQIQDDLLDITADEKLFGKQTGGDVLEGKKTYLLLHALECPTLTPADRTLLDRVVARQGLTAADVPAVRAVYDRAGALRHAEAEIARDVERARADLGPLPPGAGVEALHHLADQILRRQS